MLLFEAKAYIDERLALSDDYKEQIPEYFNSLEIASKSIEAQIRLSELLNSFFDDLSEEDSFSVDLVYEILSGIRFDAKFDEDGMFIPFEEE